MNARLIFTAAVVLVAGCSDNAPVVAQPRSLEFFKSNEAVRKKVIAVCKATFGTNEYQPRQECGTAQIADQAVAREKYARERLGDK